MNWCETHKVDYCLGLARNERLTERLRPTMDRARIRAALCGGHTREFTEFEYKTLDSWSRSRRVIGKAEILGDKDNPRFVVTNLSLADYPPQALYEELYCARGDMENAVKEHQLDLFGERLSCAGLGWVEAQTRRAGRRANAHARRRWQRPFTGEFRSGMHVDG